MDYLRHNLVQSILSQLPPHAEAFEIRGWPSPPLEPTKYLHPTRNPSIKPTTKPLTNPTTTTNPTTANTTPTTHEEDVEDNNEANKANKDDKDDQDDEDDAYDNNENEDPPIVTQFLVREPSIRRGIHRSSWRRSHW